MSPAVAVVAARAARAQGQPAQAMTLVRQVLPRAGEMAAALRLEGAEAALTLGQDPRPLLEPLLAKAAPGAHRRAATEILRRGFQELPLPALRQVLRGNLPRHLRAEGQAAAAVRGGDLPLALRVVRTGDSTRAAVAAARWLAGRPLGEADRLLVGDTLLSGGAWREARAVLDALPPPRQPAVQTQWLFLRGRAAYRLGDFAAAASLFERSLAVAATPVMRFAPAVQRGRIAEIAGDHGVALTFFEAARTAQPGEPEGWDGALRDRVALGRGEEASQLWLRAPPAVQRVVGPRLAGTLLAHRDAPRARAVLQRLVRQVPAVRALWVELLRREGRDAEARAELRTLLSDRRSGAWAELVASELPEREPGGEWPAAARDLATLAGVASEQGLTSARLALTLALAADPGWAGLIAGAVPDPAAWTGPAAELATIGLEDDAARWYPHRFPDSTPADLAWSARTLAFWGNGQAALGYGERLWERLGVPATLVPDALRPLILPPELVGACETAARAHSLSPSWLVGVVRQESRFDAGARSAAGAVGLAQFVPETLQRLGMDASAAGQADVSLTLAASELARLATAFGGRLGPAAAAYNAGDPVVIAWSGTLGDSRSEVLFAAAVPYRETSTYVLKVFEGEALAAHLR
ncbi:MAG: transglycosylase SLT domain-containing protein [Thermoanaerobaculaceae bacterium]|jgi:soluble lytic murein transglycosylase-like protein|nr:transglycosylase SLT domain-containing protein [Thermoanaerobaculaceae bacterium]